MLAFLLAYQLDHIQLFVLLNMAFLTAAIALFMYRKKRYGNPESNILTDIKAGLSVGLPYTLVVSFFLFFYYQDIYPEFNEKKRAAYELRMDSPKEIAAIRKANVDDIAATPGIGSKIASIIEEHLSTISSQKVNTETGEILGT